MSDPSLARDQVVSMARWLLILVFIVIGYWILGRLGPVLTPLLIALGIAYLLDPLVDILESKGVRRMWAVTGLLVGFIAVVVGVLAVLVPWIVHDIARFARDLPAMLERASQFLADSVGYELPGSWRDVVSGQQARDAVEQFAGPAAHLLAAALGGVFSVLAFVAEFLLVPVFAFYFLLDWEGIMRRGRSMVPPRHRVVVLEIFSDIDRVVSGWIRGQFTVTAILTILYAVSFKVIGIHLAVSVGALVGLLTVIPFLGTFAGAAVTGLVIMADYQGAGQLAAVGGVFVVLHLLEAAVLTPKIVGHRVGLGEVGALFAVLAGGKLLGLTGVLLAVPLAAAVAVLLRRLVVVYEDSEFYTGDADDVPAGQGAT